MIRYWQPWADVDTFRQRLDQMFNDLADVTNDTTDWTPAIELYDNGEAFVLRVQLPGVTPEAVNVQVARKGVVIAGDVSQPSAIAESRYAKSEFRYGTFHRVIALSVAIENEQVTADFKHGILTLTLPKVVDAQNKVVKINLSELDQAADAGNDPVES